MTTRALARLAASYVVVLVASCIGVHALFHLDPTRPPGPSATRVVSLWQGGVRITQKVVEGDPRAVLQKECAPGCSRIVERIVDEGPLLSLHPLLLAVSLAAGRDGIKAQHHGHTLYLTPSDLQSRQVSREGAVFGKYKLRIGLDDADALLADLARGLGTDAQALLAHGRLRRFIVQRDDPSAAQWPMADMDAAHLSLDQLQRAITAAAYYLVRSLRGDGRFVYELEATTGRELPDYSWPRHGGAALFLAEAAAYTQDPAIRRAALLAARYLQRSATLACGKYTCIGDGPRVDAGSAALALLAYQALIAQGHGDDLLHDLNALASFLRSLQRPDGELMHEFDRDTGRAIDVQHEYYTGETALALGRAERVTHAAADLHAASHALAHLVARRWSAVENRYDFDTHHWTCQALAELWDRAPDQDALAFCLDYQAVNRALQAGPGSQLGDYAGGFARDPYFPPRLTPAASRAEGAVATLSVAIAARAGQSVISALEHEVRSALAFTLRFQFLPGPTHLLADPVRMFGAVPASPTDLRVRIDYPQHTAGAMLHYAQLLRSKH